MSLQDDFKLTELVQNPGKTYKPYTDQNNRLLCMLKSIPGEMGRPTMITRDKYGDVNKKLLSLDPRVRKDLIACARRRMGYKNEDSGSLNLGHGEDEFRRQVRDAGIDLSSDQTMCIIEDIKGTEKRGDIAVYSVLGRPVPEDRLTNGVAAFIRGDISDMPYAKAVARVDRHNKSQATKQRIANRI